MLKADWPHVIAVMQHDPLADARPKDPSQKDEASAVPPEAKGASLLSTAETRTIWPRCAPTIRQAVLNIPQSVGLFPPAATVPKRRSQNL